ncbi:hypothetical protein NQ318_009506 [Aromia moschata]|uniref:Uncharacterized protein n=1 Tax=Aromia moschata TaxID=1265417 RepID=A0AAV8Z8F9_9CUCU|nr:hypothetical protein NQ318_009506 [Aromia moschata]
MKSRHEIPSKYAFMKVHTFDFIQNEKTNAELVHEKNVGKIEQEFYKGETSEASDTAKYKPDTSEKITKSQTYGAETSEVSIMTESRTDLSGTTPKRYTTTCYVKPATVPIWYTESLYLKIGSTKRRFEEKIYFKNKLLPYRWSENMYTEVKTAPKKNYFRKLHSSGKIGYTLYIPCTTTNSS